MTEKFIILIYTMACLTSCVNGSDNSSQTSRIDTITSKQKWVVVRYQSLCDESKEGFLDLKKLNKYGKFHSFDTIQTYTIDSTIISFDFISDCCEEFSGDATVVNDTLTLFYFKTNDVSCDCYCDYRMTYHIDTKDRQWKGIKIKQGSL